jgi:hypothetical protein
MIWLLNNNQKMFFSNVGFYSWILLSPVFRYKLIRTDPMLDPLDSAYDAKAEAKSWIRTDAIYGL